MGLGLPIIGALADMGKQWLSNRREKSQAKHEKDLRVIAGDQAADTAASEGMATSWKDEYLTVLFSIPLIVVFHAAVWGDPADIEKVKAAFAAMGELPEWFQYGFLGCVIATFGLRGMAKFIARRGG